VAVDRADWVVSNPLRIIQIHATDGGGGAETVVRVHHQQLQHAGHTSHLLVGRKITTDAQTTQIPFVRGPKGVLRLTRWLERVTGLQNLYSPSFRQVDTQFHYRPDILHIHSLHGVESFSDLRVLPRLSQRYPTVISLHDLWLMTGHCGHPLDCQRWKLGCGRCPDLTLYPAISRDATACNFMRKQRILERCRLHLIVPSEWLKQQVKQSSILGNFPVTVVANPVDTVNFRPGNAIEIRRRFGIKDDEKTVIMIAQHLDNPYKGIAEGIAALNAVETQDLKIILVGHAADDVARRINVPSLILPFTSDPIQLADYYRLADVLLMPSRGETFGLVAAEAMSCGIPVVCPAVGGLTDVIGQNEGGILTPARDSAAMAEAIRHLLSDRELRTQLSGAGRARAETLFCQKLHTEKCVAVYRDVIARFRALA
jgi:glycosyltransferase involved in cell wall biosynthesis